VGRLGQCVVGLDKLGVGRGLAASVAGGNRSWRWLLTIRTNLEQAQAEGRESKIEGDDVNWDWLKRSRKSCIAARDSARMQLYVGAQNAMYERCADTSHPS
jgi:hypothetical protein